MVAEYRCIGVIIRTLQEDRVIIDENFSYLFLHVLKSVVLSSSLTKFSLFKINIFLKWMGDISWWYFRQFIEISSFFWWAIRGTGSYKLCWIAKHLHKLSKHPSCYNVDWVNSIKDFRNILLSNFHWNGPPKKKK